MYNGVLHKHGTRQNIVYNNVVFEAVEAVQKSKSEFTKHTPYSPLQMSYGVNRESLLCYNGAALYYTDLSAAMFVKTDLGTSSNLP